MAIRLVTFDALHTLITPRRPIHVQYSEVFAPFLGVLDPNLIKRSFNVALKDVQVESPAYSQGADAWWGEVIRRTALGAGADERVLDASIHKIVPTLLERFSSREGYTAFEDAIPTIQHLHDELGVATAVISNGDSRIRSVIRDLGFPPYLSPIILSEEEGVEKPARKIFERALSLVNVNNGKTSIDLKMTECLHVGDELVCDFQGASEAGMQGFLLRRTGPDGEQAHKEPDESLNGVEVIKNLEEVVSFVTARNS
ncbi:Haloacid dehalogenase-like hydrolase domain-containing protein 3 [Leucoagaricus sp. SymC.cos]|nr:Haloacid dehalogenase-like hydrolase domain-containing protein 3 [Leucoagaricus sp. SymC.cos]